MAYFRTGGGSDGLDFLNNNPDVTDSFNLNPSSTRNITVTQKPRFIMVYRTLNPSSSTQNYTNGIAVIYDVKNDIGYIVGNNSAGPTFNNGISLIIGNITNNAVEIKNLSSSTTSRYYNNVGIWY